MNKHAYLIMAYNQWDILKKLLILLDDEKHDIYLHIDKKTHDMPHDITSWTKESKVYVFQTINVMWADYSQIECELFLLEKARKNGDYSFFHLLSGVDLPIKPKAVIYNFFESNLNSNFVGIVPKEVYYSVRRVKYYHLFTKVSFYRNCKLLKVADRCFEYLQKLFFIDRLKGKKLCIIDGWQWFSINKEFTDYVLGNKMLIKSTFKNTIASDELVFQTMAYNSEFRKTLFDENDLKKGSMRCIDWERGKPYTWGNDSSDFEMLIKSECMFARKFDENHMEIVDRIFWEMNRRNTNEQ